MSFLKYFFRRKIIIGSLLAFFIALTWDVFLYKKQEWTAKEAILLNVEIQDTIIYEIESATIFFDKQHAELALMDYMAEYDFVDPNMMELLVFLESLPNGCVFDDEGAASQIVKGQMMLGKDTITQEYNGDGFWESDTIRTKILTTNNFSNSVRFVAAALMSKGKVSVFRKTDNQWPQKIILQERTAQGYYQSFFEFDDGIFLLSKDAILYCF